MATCFDCGGTVSRGSGQKRWTLVGKSQNNLIGRLSSASRSNDPLKLFAKREQYAWRWFCDDCLANEQMKLQGKRRQTFADFKTFVLIMLCGFLVIVAARLMGLIGN